MKFPTTKDVLQLPLVIARETFDAVAARMRLAARGALRSGSIAIEPTPSRA